MQLLTLNLQRLEEIEANADKFSTDPSFEEDLLQLVEAKKAIEQAMKQIQASFKEKFINGNLENSIEGDLIRVTVSQSGSIYKLVDETVIDPHLLKVDIDSGAVQEFVDKNEKLPDGVAYNESRSVAVRISVKGGKGE